MLPRNSPSLTRCSFTIKLGAATEIWFALMKSFHSTRPSSACSSCRDRIAVLYVHFSPCTYKMFNILYVHRLKCHNDTPEYAEHTMKQALGITTFTLDEVILGLETAFFKAQDDLLNNRITRRIFTKVVEILKAAKGPQDIDYERVVYFAGS